jgi:hypothetical protein
MKYSLTKPATVLGSMASLDRGGFRRLLRVVI